MFPADARPSYPPPPFETSVIVLALLAFVQTPADTGPPVGYWQQDVAYAITARLDEPAGTLSGGERISYRNNSPDTLTSFALHLYLNAFRPGSRWADADSIEGKRRFNDLHDPDFAFNHVRDVRIMGQVVEPTYPFAPDSTVVRFALPQPLTPGDSMTVEMQWDARPSTVPRRQGREGRRFDFAQWYPKVVVYDRYGWEEHPLYPGGEFYGEFGRYTVDLDVPEDQVIGATGVPVSGDPGWARVNRDSTHAPALQRNAYAPRAPVALGLLGKTEAGRKRVRWRAEHVHHFAWSADPNFIYEGDKLGAVALHVLYLPGDTLWPGDAIATLKQSVLFYDSVMGPYLYPQLTALRRIEGGGTEFPMMQMDGANPPIVHETAHEWAHAMLANNEFKSGWLDEGFASFLGFMYNEAQGRPGNFQRAVDAIARLDATGQSQPVATPGADYRTFALYQQMTYTKGSLVLRMLRYYIGDAAFRRGLKLYYQDNKLEHVDEADLRAAMETASGQSLGTFFQQWLHTTGTLDWAVANATTAQQPTGAWQTTVEITRSGDNWLPVDLRVADKTVRVDSHDAHYTAVVTTAQRPQSVVLDPDFVLLDSDRSNNTRQVN